MTRVDQRRALKAFSRDYSRELHNLLATDLGRSPQFVFQQLYNRLQWQVTEGEAAERITAEAARRCAPGRPPWLCLRTRTRESEALIRTFVGHDREVKACAFSPDGRTIVSASEDGTLKLWDAETGCCEATLEGHGGWVYACAFSPDGRRTISASWDYTLRLWDAKTGREIARIPTPYSLLCIAVHAAPPRLAFGDNAGIVSVVDLHDVAEKGATPTRPAL